MVDRHFIEGKQPDGDATDLIVPYAEQSAIGSEDLYHGALFGLAVDTCHGAGEDPRMEAQHGLLLLGLEVNLGVCHEQRCL